jgi:predicted RNA binding protein YcfA (HicA-like mRNA interferase family)
MPAWRPISRRALVATLRRLGFAGPYSGGKHEFMVRGDRVLTIPNPHRGDIGIGLLALVLQQAGVSRKEWERLR